MASVDWLSGVDNPLFVTSHPGTHRVQELLITQGDLSLNDFFRYSWVECSLRRVSSHGDESHLVFPSLGNLNYIFGP